MVDSLLREIRRVYADGVQQGGETTAYLPQIIAAIDDGGDPTDLEPRVLPAVERHLATTLEAARRAGASDLAAAIDEHRGGLHWLSTHDFYGDDPSIERFQSDYAFTAIMAPSSRGRYGLVTNDRTFFGLSLQGPDTYYPAHAHDAVEIYYVIAGTAEWRRGAETWRTYPPGSFIFHDSGVAHAMRTAGEPLLCLYAWVSDLASSVRLVEDFD